ncbi:hypothetical protein ACWEN6_00680 [Sphaerisporangium sp. NPDC004334]
MPALATRFTEGTADRRGTGSQATAPREPRSPASGDETAVSARLQDEFLGVPVEVVDRCVEDVEACAAHLGVDVTTAVVERIAREHLLAVASSVPLTDRPPSGAHEPRG